MSFGFSIGDFIAVAELAERLYKDIYLVARHASQEVLQLQSEVATMSMSMRLLLAEIQDKNSVLAQGGEERINAVNSVLMSTMGVLNDLDRFSRSFAFMEKKPGLLNKSKAVWDRMKFAKDLPKVDALRARLQYQNGTINLLLISAGNSSLQRIETTDRRMHADIERLAKMVEQLTHQTPENESADFKSPLTARFLKEAEQGGRRWFSYGFDEWLQAGQWWLMSCQGRLVSIGPGDPKIGLQPYANLLKSSSILLDILPRHPSIRLWDPTKEYLQFQLLADMLSRELDAIATTGLQKPELSEVEKADLRIWTDAIKTVTLQPEGNSWETADEETLWIGSGSLQVDFAGIPESCLMFILLSKRDITKARIIAHNQKGIELVNLQINFDLLRERNLRGNPIGGNNLVGDIKVEYANCKVSLGNAKDKIHLGSVIFGVPNSELLDELSTVLRGITFVQNVRGLTKDHSTIHAIILLFAISSGNRVLLQKIFDLCQTHRCLEFCISEPKSLLDLSKSIALDILQDSSDDYLASVPTLFPEPTQAALMQRIFRNNRETVLTLVDNYYQTPANELAKCIHYWSYQIMAVLASKDRSLSVFDCMYCEPQITRPEKYTYGYFDTKILEGVGELAAILGDPQLLKFALKESGMDINQQRKKNRWIPSSGTVGFLEFCYTYTLLHSAAVFAQASCVQLLLDQGADPKVRYVETVTEGSGGQGNTPGEIATYLGYAEIVDILSSP